MKIWSTNTRELIEISWYMNGQDMASEILGQYDDPMIVWNHDTEQLEGTRDAIQWWENYIQTRKQINALVNDRFDQSITWASNHEFVYAFWEIMPTDPEGHTLDQAKLVLDTFV